MQDSPRHFQLPSDNQIRLFLVFLAGVAAALWLGLQVGKEKNTLVFGILTVTAVFAVMHFLGDRYWMIILVGLSDALPSPLILGRNLNTNELAHLAVIAMAFVRVVLRRQKFRLFDRRFLPVFLLATWTLLAFVKNPSGLAIFGSEIVGARWYFQLFLSFGAFFVFSSVVIRRTDIFWIFVSLVGVTALEAIPAFLHAQSALSLDPFQAVGRLAYYGPMQSLAGVALVIYTLLLARYPLPELFSLARAWFLPLLALLGGLGVMSGKRMGLLSLVVQPLFAAILRRNFFAAALLSVGSVLALGVLVVGHGRYFRLPSSAQRALSVVPGDWDLDAYAGASDDFRAAMRAIAAREIAKNPWFGRGFTLNVDESFAEQMMYGRGIREEMGGSSAFAHGSWHNQWFGTAADLGIPAAIFYAALYIQMLVVAYRMVPRTRTGDPFHTFSAYVFLRMCLTIMTSYTGGGATIFVSQAWLFGIFWAVHRTLGEEKAAQLPVPPLSEGASRGDLMIPRVR